MAINTKTVKLDQIRDVIYDYIDITPFEKTIIETPFFQRLRFIFQNSSAYLTYPSNQLTRFSHSLGVMHIGGLIFREGLVNATLDVKNDFYRLNEDVIEEIITKYRLGNSFNQLKNYWKNNDKSYTKNNFFDVQEEQTFAYNIFWQAVRIACLCHDIGHLPFSHIFEMAIEDFNMRSGRKLGGNLIKRCAKTIRDVFNIEVETKKLKATDLHELIGAYLLCCLYKSMPERDTGEENDLFKLCLGLAAEIFLREKTIFSPSNQKAKELFSCYYPIISSDLDADRIDYILRDAKSSGLDLGDFDFTRILRHIKLIKKAEQRFTFVPSDKSISSIDQFFNYRYLMYEYVYYHHNVAKYDGILIEILSSIFNEVLIKKNKEFKALCLEKYNLVDGKGNIFPLARTIKDTVIVTYEYYDDCWLRNLLHDILIENNKKRIFKDSYLISLIETFLFRKKENASSWAKSSIQIDKNLADEDLLSLINSSDFFRLKYKIVFNKELSFDVKVKWDKIKSYEDVGLIQKRMGKYSIDKLIMDNETRMNFRVLLSKKHADKSYEEKVKKLRAEMRKKGVLLITKKLSPKVLSGDQEILIKNTGLKRLGEASFYLHNFSNMQDTHFKYYFGFFKEKINDGNNVQLHNECAKMVNNLLFELLDEILFLLLPRTTFPKK